VVVVGGGIAGMVFAVRALELGCRVVVVEQGEDPLYRCNTRFTGGAFHICFRDIDDPASELAQAIRTATHGFAAPHLAEAVATDARHAVRWLQRQGIRLIKVGPDAWRQHFLAPPSLLQPGLHWKGRGGDMLLRTLHDVLNANGGALILGAKATRLLTDGTRCTGLEYRQSGTTHTLHSDAVMLCDGGFQANLELLRQYVSPAPEKLKQRGAGVSRGDALRMALELDAATTGMENIYGHLLCQDALSDDRLWPYPIIDLIAGASIVVEANGRRFMDEGLGGVCMTNGIARLADPLGATVIFDRAIWNGPATDFILPANPHLVRAGGTIVSASSLRGLAEKIGVDADTLESTVAVYNAAVTAGNTATLDPPRTAKATKPFPILNPPFHAVRLAAGITFTMGGLLTDDVARVMRSNGDPIDGLYASGCCTGGLEGGITAGYVSGLTKSSAMSWRAAAHVAGASTISTIGG
jgi:fumarate reductase flavoprotein subunit